MAGSRFPLIQVSGNHHEIGVQFGHAAAEGIRRFLALILDGARQSRGWTRDETLRYSLLFLPLFEQHCPHLLPEIHGLAEGAGVSFAEALLLQLRAEVTQVAEGCSAFALSRAVTADGRVLAGQNSDMSPEMEELGLILKITPDAGPRILMFTFRGLLGYHGMNSAGVAHFANALPARPWRMALPHYPLKRMFLETTSVQDCLRLMKRVPVCSTGNYVLADGQGSIADAGVAPDAADPHRLLSLAR
jgi:isopenicillin-N N-acyltransferase like protein